MNTKQKQIISTMFPDLAGLPTRDTSPDLLARMLEGFQMLKGEKGDKGESGKDGYSPKKGEDYLTDSDLSIIRQKITPRKGIDYRDGKDGRDGKNGKDGLTGEKGIMGMKGKDGSPDSGAEIANKLNVYKGILNASVIFGLPDVEELVTKAISKIKTDKILSSKDINMSDMRWHGGLGFVTTDSTLTGRGTPASPLSVVSVSGSILPVTGIINDINVTFSVASTPSEVVINGSSYIGTGGAITWTYVGTTLTLSSPVGTGGSIYARR